jgi:hypothetical protein
MTELKTKDDDIQIQQPDAFWLPTWEYHRLRVPDRQPQTGSQLNSLGREGWELVAIYQYQGNIDYVFKRPRPEKP